jgi:hypothetical protein
MTQRQLDIFGNDHPVVPEVSARATDPTSSHVTVRSLAKDGSSYRMILMAVCKLHLDDDALWTDKPYWVPGATHLTTVMPRLVTDDLVVAYLERITGRRFQRNVTARSRGLLEPDYIQRVGVMADSTGRSILHYVPTELALAWFSGTDGVL